MRYRTTLSLLNPNINKNAKKMLEEESSGEGFFYRDSSKEYKRKTLALITTHSIIWGTIATVPVLTSPIVVSSMGLASVLMGKEHIEEYLKLKKENKMVKSIKMKDFLQQ